MIDVGRWTYNAERRVAQAVDDTVSQLEYEANALWKGKPVTGETRWQTPWLRVPLNATVTRVAVTGCSDPEDGARVMLSFYAQIPHPETGVLTEVFVLNPQCPDEQTP